MMRKNILGDIRSTILALLIGIGFIVAALFILLGTYYFTRYYWGPAIMTWFS